MTATPPVRLSPHFLQKARPEAAPSPPCEVELVRGAGLAPAAHVDEEPLRGVRVLVVEDDPDTRDVFALGLELAGAETLTAATAGEALRLVREQAPDVLLSDIGLPDEDGCELIRHVRALPPEEGGQTPAVAVTAFTLADDRRRALEAGFESFLPKPVDARHLLATIAAVVHATRSGDPDPDDRRGGHRRRSPGGVRLERRFRERRQALPERGA